MSAPETTSLIRECPLDIVEIVAYRDGVSHPQWPTFGQAAQVGTDLSLSVRPERWLVLSEPGLAAATAVRWESMAAGSVAAVDLSSALVAFCLAGAAAREMLTRGCRLDLDPLVLPARSAAATFIAQVAVTLVVMPGGLLLLTPSTTARHFREWLVSTARPFGFMLGANWTLTDLLRSEWS